MINVIQIGMNILLSTGLAGSLVLGMAVVPRWRRAEAARRVLQSYARLDDYGRPVAR